MPSVKEFNAARGITPNKPRKKTPEEEALAQEQGNEFIRQREQAAAKLVQAGNTPAAAVRIAQQQVTPIVAAQQITPMTATSGQAEQKFLEENKATLAQQPEAVSLAPKTIPEEKAGIPMGSAIGALAAQQTLAVKGIQADRNFLRQRAAILWEGIPLIAKVGRRIGINLGTPSGKVDELKKNLDAFDDDVANALNIAAMSPNDALMNLDIMDDGINELERRIQYLINISPDLRSNPDEVDLIEKKILEKRRNIFRARGTITQGVIAQNI